MADLVAMVMSGLAVLVNVFGLLTYWKAHKNFSKENEFYSFSLWMSYAIAVFVLQNIAVLANTFTDYTTVLIRNISIVLTLFTGVILLIAADLFKSYSTRMSFRA